MPSSFSSLNLAERNTAASLRLAAALLLAVVAGAASAADDVVSLDPASEVLILYHRDDGAASTASTPGATPTAPARAPTNPFASAPAFASAGPATPVEYGPPGENSLRVDAAVTPAAASQVTPAAPTASPAFAQPAVAPLEAEFASAMAAARPLPAPLPSPSTVEAATPIESPLATASRRLSPPSHARAGNEPARPSIHSFGDLLESQRGTLSTAAMGLALVVGLFLLCAWLMKPARTKASGVLPTEAFEVLGRAPLIGQSAAHLLRLGNKLVLISISPDGAQTLAEVTDPLEVGRLAGLCAGTRANSPTAEFQQVLAQLSREPARGFLGREASSSRRKA